MSGRSSLSRGLRTENWVPVFKTVGSLLSAAALLVLSFAIFCWKPSPVAAQKAAPVPNAAVEHGFSIPFDDRLGESLAKFDEFVKTRAWEKAFRILADIREDKWSTMLPDREGFIRPASAHLRETILELPADGREAYRLYFDAKARRLLASMATASKEDDVKIARTIYDRYFITSVGDDAADRLADDYFEHGQFAEAARCWKSIFDYHPDTNLPEPRILVKRAIALFRGGLNAEYHSVRQQLEQQFPGTKVTLGRREIVAEDYFKGLDAEAKSKPLVSVKVVSENAFRGLAPADGTKPVWQFRLLEEQDLTAIEESMRNWYGAASFTSFLPAAATDGERIYGNWLGACFAIDVATGKTVWSTEPGVKKVLAGLRNNYARLMSYSANPGQFSLTLAQVGEGTRVLLTVVPSQTEVNRFHLVAFNAQTGKRLWTTDRVTPEATKASYLGTPLVEGDSVYALSHQVTPQTDRNGNGENGVAASAVSLRRLDLRSGTELWSLMLGTPQLVGNGYGQQFLPTPALVLSGGHLYVLTNDGALLSVSVDRRQIDWVYKYPPPNFGQNRAQFFVAARTPGLQPRTTGPIVVRDGVIYFKETMGATLYALEENGPRCTGNGKTQNSPIWLASTIPTSTCFTASCRRFRATKPETRWSNRLTVELPGVGAQIGSQAILVFTPRGLFELSKETGDVRRIFRGSDLGAAGGFVLSAGKRLVSVSNLAVTAYPDAANN